MKRFLQVLQVAAVGFCAAIAISVYIGPVSAQIASNPLVQLSYLTPRSARLKPVADHVKKWQVLEQFGQFLVPLRLPRKLAVQFDECGSFTPSYRPGGPVTVCYELVDKIEGIAAKAQPERRDLVLVGTIIQAVFHETAIAVFDVLRVPIWGRREDAADRLAGFLMVEFGPELAKRLIIGAAVFFKESGKTWTGSQFAEASAPEAQRFYNYLCMAYGSEPKTFSSFVQTESGDDFALPSSRARLCKIEFEQVRKAFDLRIMPYVDPDLLVQIRAKPWLLFASANP
jgi:Putative metallopeptidase